MRGAESPPSFDLEKSFLYKTILFLDKNHFLFYYPKLETPVFTVFRNYTDFFINLRDLHVKQGCREREESRCSCLSAILTNSSISLTTKLLISIMHDIEWKSARKHPCILPREDRNAKIDFISVHSEAQRLCSLERINFLYFVLLLTQLLSSLVFIKKTAVRASPPVLINKK